MEKINIEMGNLPLSDNRPTVDCGIHGKDSEARMNGKCNLCFKEMKQQELDFEKRHNHLKQKEKALIPPRFMECTFDNYYPDNIRATQLLEFTKIYGFNKNILMVGLTGNGKTHLACAILDGAITKGLSCLYVPFYKATEYKIKKPEVFAKMIKCNILVIDEFGVYQSDFKDNLLFEIINERYNNFGHTILISNMQIDKFKASIGDPLYSRLRENVTVKACDWEDYRLKKAS